MPWRETDAMSQRIEFVVRALASPRNMSALCREFGIARKTGYKWLRRYQESGSLAGLREQSRRPHHSPRRTPPELEQRVAALRRRYGWSGRKLHHLLRREGLSLSPATIDRILQRRGLIRQEPRRTAPTRRFERAAPNQLWQMDFKGEYPLRPRGWCYPLSLLDDHSRYSVGLFALERQTRAAVQPWLIACWERWGVPEAILLDHGVPWWSNTNAHGLTQLAVAMIRQGIELIYAAIRHPQTQGKVERFHGTLERSLQHRGLPHTVAGFQRAFDTFRQEYNELRPHEALAMQVPAARYRPSRRSYQPHPPEWEYPPGADVHQLNTAGCLEYGHRRYFVCEALAGERIRCRRFAERLLVTYRHMYIREIDLRTGRTTAVVRPAEGD